MAPLLPSPLFQNKLGTGETLQYIFLKYRLCSETTQNYAVTTSFDLDDAGCGINGVLRRAKEATSRRETSATKKKHAFN